MASTSSNSRGSTSINNTVAYDQYSRLRQYPIIFDSLQKVNRLGNKDFTIINTIKQNVTFSQWKITPQYQYRPDSIAFFFYGNPELWWVISGYNSFFNIPQDFYVNRVIMIPSAEGVVATLS
jgi:hypothetical protein